MVDQDHDYKLYYKFKRLICSQILWAIAALIKTELNKQFLVVCIPYHEDHNINVVAII